MHESCAAYRPIGPRRCFLIRPSSTLQRICFPSLSKKKPELCFRTPLRRDARQSRRGSHSQLPKVGPLIYWYEGRVAEGSAVVDCRKGRAREVSKIFLEYS